MKSVKIIVLSFVICSLFGFAFSFHEDSRGIHSKYHAAPMQTSVKSRALLVLKNKCNDCHLKKNKSVIFDARNMDGNARRINKMVFVKKKMPKDDVVLTAKERQDLKTWLVGLGYK